MPRRKTPAKAQPKTAPVEEVQKSEAEETEETIVPDEKENVPQENEEEVFIGVAPSKLIVGNDISKIEISQEQLEPTYVPLFQRLKDIRNREFSLGEFYDKQALSENVMLVDIVKSLANTADENVLKESFLLIRFFMKKHEDVMTIPHLTRGISYWGGLEDLKNEFLTIITSLVNVSQDAEEFKKTVSEELFFNDMRTLSEDAKDNLKTVFFN